MKHGMKKCLEIRVTEQENVCIELREPYENVVLQMIPGGKVVDAIPNIWYVPEGNEVSFFCDKEEVFCVEKANIFDLMFVVENYIESQCKLLILHGGAIAYNNRAIAFIQSRKSGKSTLIRGLLNDADYEYISDDLLLYRNKELAGVALPIRVRDKLEKIVECNGQYIGAMLDESGEDRNIYVPTNQVKTGFTKMSAIVLPQYVSENCNEIKEIKGTQKVVSILKNIKEYQNMDFLYSSMVEMAQTIPLYELRYHDMKFAKKALRELWDR